MKTIAKEKEFRRPASAFLAEAAAMIITFCCAGAATVYASASPPDQAVSHTIARLEKWAATGNARAPYDLAMLYFHGYSVDQDDARAFGWMKKSAESGFVNAEYNLGLMYLEGIGTKADDRQAFGWIKRAAYDGSLEAQYVLAWMYQQGRGTKADAAEAAELYVWLGETGADWEPFAVAIFRFYDKAADDAVRQGYLNEACRSAWIAGYDGYDVTLLKRIIRGAMGAEQVREAEAAAEAFVRKARPLEDLTSRAEDGDTDAMYKLGLHVPDGEGVAKDYDKGVQMV
jgi:uncharacterized protein